MPNNNKGKIRNVPHVDGNFHTLCYIQVPLSNQLINIARKSFSTLNKLIKIDHKLFGSVNDVESQSSISEEEGECVNSDGQYSTKLDRNYAHLSLCKPLYLKRQFIDSFLDKLRRELERVKPFYLLLNTSITICANELYTRYFAVLPVSDLSRNESILPIIDLVDKVVESFGYPKYYIQRQPHVSLSSTTRDLVSTMNKLYKEEDSVKYSSHHWSGIDEIVNRWPEVWDYNGDDTSTLETVEYNVNVPEAALEEAMSEVADDEDICFYINEIHVLIGAKDVVITLQ